MSDPMNIRPRSGGSVVLPADANAQAIDEALRINTVSEQIADKPTPEANTESVPTP